MAKTGRNRPRTSGKRKGEASTAEKIASNIIMFAIPGLGTVRAAATAGKVAPRVLQMVRQLGGKKIAKPTAVQVKNAKPTSALKPKSAKSKTPTKPTATAASKANRAKSQGGRTTQQAKQAAKKQPPKKAAAKKPAPNVITALRNNPTAKRAILGGAVTSATLATIDDIRKSGKGAAVAAPTSRPKRSSVNVTGPTSRPKRKGPGVGRTDKSDPRKGFASKATPGAKPTPKRKPKDKNDPRGNQIKAISSLPAGALRKFQGSYNKKTEKLKNIGGKTYVMKR